MGTPNSRRNGPLSLKEASGTILSPLHDTKPILVMPHTLPRLLQCRQEGDAFFRVPPNGAQIPPQLTHRIPRGSALNALPHGTLQSLSGTMSV